MKIEKPLAFPPEVALRIRAIASDMDGTFFATGLKVLPSTLAAYKRAQAAGIPIIPATGRSREGVAGVFARAGCAQEVDLFPGVYLNGCFTFGPDDEPLIQSRLNLDTIKLIREFCAKVREIVHNEDPKWFEREEFVRGHVCHGFPAVRDKSLPHEFVSLTGYCSGAKDIVMERRDQLSDGLDLFQEGNTKVVGPLDEHVHQSEVAELNAMSTYPNRGTSVKETGFIAKALIVFHAEEHANRFRPLLAEMLAGKGTISAGVPRIVEVNPLGINKSYALKKVCTRLDLPLDCVLAIGDGENDLPMLKACGFSVAMGNGLDIVKQTASVVTGANNDGGWADAVNTFLDIREKLSAFRCILPTYNPKGIVSNEDSMDVSTDAYSSSTSLTPASPETPSPFKMALETALQPAV